MTAVSIIVVSFNTRDCLRQCLRTLEACAGKVPAEIFVVDNLSEDGSAEMVAREFSAVRLIRSEVNEGFAAANNRAIRLAAGRYIVLLNSDAFIQCDGLRRAIDHMDADGTVGVGGARLTGRDGSWQPSGRLFPSPLNDFLALSGLAARHPTSRFFGRFDRTWANAHEAADVDWVPGAFSIIRRSALELTGCLDERFFLYYEEVDLCRRMKRAGYRVRYWPDLVVVHLGGESSRTLKSLKLSPEGSQLALWRMRSGFLYYRKYGMIDAWLAKAVESLWHQLRAAKNLLLRGEEGKRKAAESNVTAGLLRQAWKETAGGVVCPPRPW